MDERYLSALIGSEVRVCGYKLARLTLWHMTLLEAIGSPFVVQKKGQSIYPRDIVIFCKVLQSSYPSQPKLSPTISDALFIRQMERKPRKYIDRLKAIRGWLKEELSLPVLYQGDSNNFHKHSTPSMLALNAAICSRTNERHAEVWNMRLAAARWLDVALAEIDGAKITISFENEEKAPDSPEGLEAIEMAREKLPPHIFKKWLANQKKNKKDV
jgi:hypothetical protein